MAACMCLWARKSWAVLRFEASKRQCPTSASQQARASLYCKRWTRLSRSNGFGWSQTSQDANATCSERRLFALVADDAMV